jgi:hypothetical protein
MSRFGLDALVAINSAWVTVGLARNALQWVLHDARGRRTSVPFPSLVSAACSARERMALSHMATKPLRRAAALGAYP